MKTMLKEMWADTPRWMKALVVTQIVMYVFVMIGMFQMIAFIASLDWSHGLEGVLMPLWKGTKS